MTIEALGIGRTDIGKMREQNEDRLYIDNDLGLYIVSDGMGGHAAGEEASRLAVDAVVRSIKDDRAKLLRVRQGLEVPNAAIPIAQEAAVSQLRNMLTRALGSQETVLVETLLLDVLPGDRYLLCSDGLSQYAGETVLAQHLSGELEGIAEDLIAFANDSGGSDNTTVIVISIEAEEAEQGSVSAVAGDLQVKFDTLQSVFLFEDLPLAHLQRLLNTCEVETFDAGETVTRQGERCAKMFVVLEGKLTLQQDDREIAELAAGDCVGEASLVATRFCRCSILSKESVRLLVVRRDRFASLVQKRPWFGLTLLQRLAKRSVQAADRLHDRLLSLEHAGKPAQLEASDFF